MKKVIRKVKVKNTLGLHARPAAAIAKLLQKFKSDVTITYQQKTMNARSIISILMLTARKNAQVTLMAEGEDAEEAMDVLEVAFENQFGEVSL